MQFQQLAARPAHAVVLRGAGRCFSAGVELRDHYPESAERMLAAMHGLIEAMWRIECPLLAVVHGVALGGGCELALACDAVVARDDAELGLPEVTVGAFPPLAAVLLPQLLPWPRAFELLAGRRRLTAGEALQWGLVNAVFARENFDSEVEAWMGRLLSSSRAVLRQAKKALRAARPTEPTLALLSSIETQYLQELVTLQDASEGLTAFLEKRAPRWTHG